MDDRDLRVCQVCGEDKKPNQMRDICGPDEPQVIHACEHCVEEYEEEAGVEFDSDVLIEESFNAFRKWAELQQNNSKETEIPAASLIVRMIDGFEKQCQREQYTDTDRLWDLFAQIRELLLVKQVEGPIYRFGNAEVIENSLSTVEEVGRLLCEVYKIKCSFELAPGFIDVPLADGRSMNIGTCNEFWGIDITDLDHTDSDHSVDFPFRSDSKDTKGIAFGIAHWIMHWNRTNPASTLPA